MLSPQTIATVKATAPVLVEHGETLTRHFYRRMFEGDPEVRAFFNPAHQNAGTQQRALAGAICAYAQNIDNLAVLGPAVELIAQKHASLNIKAEHYPIVGKHLLESIKEVLGDAATDDIINAWAEAYGFLADILIGRESELYQQHEQEHGWSGFRPFIVDRMEAESDNITSFYLKPRDGGELADWKPGQYLTLRVPTADGGTTMRNYSLSTRPGQGHYRISVKRESSSVDSAAPGVVSNYLHDAVGVGDVLEVGPPCGEFVLEIEPARASDRPLVFLSGGVGITPLLAMFDAAIDAGLDCEMFFLHGAVNGNLHALSDEVRALASRNEKAAVHFRYSQPTDEDRTSRRFDSEGLIDLPLIRQAVGDLDANYYICGPKPFMTGLYAELLRAGVSEDRINVEFFGPKQDLADIRSHAKS